MGQCLQYKNFAWAGVKVTCGPDPEWMEKQRAEEEARLEREAIAKHEAELAKEAELKKQRELEREKEMADILKKQQEEATKAAEGQVLVVLVIVLHDII